MHTRLDEFHNIAHRKFKPLYPIQNWPLSSLNAICPSNCQLWPSSLLGMAHDDFVVFGMNRLKSLAFQVFGPEPWLSAYLFGFCSSTWLRITSFNTPSTYLNVLVYISSFVGSHKLDSCHGLWALPNSNHFRYRHYMSPTAFKGTLLCYICRLALVDTEAPLVFINIVQVVCDQVECVYVSNN